jgi:hypothetical protein
VPGKHIRRAVVVAIVVGVVLGAAMVGRGGASGRSADRPTYYQDVKPIFDARCAGCHVSGGLAPFALRTYGQAYTRRHAVADAVTRRFMPPWHAAPGFQRYKHDPSLSDAQIATIRRWVARGAAKGDPARPAPALPPLGARLSRADLSLRLPAYTPRKRPDGDDYRCLVSAWPASEPAYVTGADIRPGERHEVHHMIVYLAPPSSAGTVDAWDAADPAPGYRCYGGPGASGRTLSAVQLLAGWAPGSSGADFAAGTGIRVLPGSRLITQVHYNLDHVHHPRPDRSIVELKLDPTVEREAIFLPIVDFRWPFAPATFAIPAGKKKVVHAYAYDPRPAAGFLAPGLDLSRGFVVHSVLHHMHRLGKRGQIAIERAGGQREVLLSIRSWDFNWQRAYELERPVSFLPGDRVSIRCEHDNSAANQPAVGGKRARPRPVTWGEDSSDEMCIGFLFVSEP